MKIRTKKGYDLTGRVSLPRKKGSREGEKHGTGKNNEKMAN